MRVPQFFLCLLGLACLAVAAPTLSDTTSSDAAHTTNDGPDAVNIANISAVAAPGDTVICENTLDNGHCELLHAQDRCVTLGQKLSHKVRTIHQAAGSVCKYFESDCFAPHPVISVNSRNKPVSVTLEKDVGTKIGLVLCGNDWTTAELQPNSASIQAHDISTSSSSPGFIYVCKSSLVCLPLQAFNQCLKLPASYYHRVDTIWQKKGLVCKYFRSFLKPSCVEKWPVVIIDSRGKDIQWNTTGIGNNIGSVLCKESPWNSAVLEADFFSIITNGSVSFHSVVDEYNDSNVEILDEASSKITILAGSYALPATHLDALDTEQSDVIPHSLKDTRLSRSEAGIQPLYICRHPNLQGRCTFYEAPACANNPFGSDAIQSLIVRAGFRCAFYHKPNCEAFKSPPHYVEARVGDKPMTTLPYAILSMACNTIPFFGSDEAPFTSVYDTSAAGDTLFCDAANFSACRNNLNAMNRCSNFDPAAGGPNSLKQYQGAFCKWYRGFGCSRESKDNEPMAIDSRAGNVGILDLAENSNRFKSVACRGEPF
ncbi:hypothetical protein BKA66DRAFT_42204 [Pyrenochaeta sp. MPI-SDFR-AT-0127]|nr:hypothetical protein BKA66DRAFT_42204 [Pyrenochaeta sp. MPI-SDFR-AT-0127]